MTSPNPPDEPLDLQEIERALAKTREREEKLLRQREQVILADPGQRKERRRSRYIFIGRWRSSTQCLTADDMIELSKFDPGLAWLLGRDVLLADGWKEDPANKRWRPPVSDRSSRDG